MAFALTNQSLFYGECKVVDNISLEIKEGERVALLGKSGSGKSTLIRHLYSIKSEESSYIPQELGVVDNLSTFHNVYMGRLDRYSTFFNIRNLLVPCKKIKKEVEEILKTLHLTEFLNKRCGELSGGQRQRSAIARSLFGKRDVLLADEPISALDEFLTGRVLETLKTNFKTMVVALHNVDIATEHFDRVIGLKNGKVVIDKSCDTLTEQDRKDLYESFAEQ